MRVSKITGKPIMPSDEHQTAHYILTHPEEYAHEPELFREAWIVAMAHHGKSVNFAKMGLDAAAQRALAATAAERDISRKARQIEIRNGRSCSPFDGDAA